MQTIPFWIHATHCKRPDANAFVIKEKVLVIDDAGNKTWKDNLRIINDPRRPFWITKPGFRSHKYKKEFEYEKNLEKYTVRDSEMIEKLKKSLDIYSRRTQLRELCNSPYVYGADIDTGVLIRKSYNDKTVGMLPQLSVGSMDIENEVRGEKRINVFSFNVGKYIYCAYLKEYLMKVDQHRNRIPATQEELWSVINEELKDEISTYGFEIVIHESNTELDLIKWVFDRIHEHKTDFVGVWNMNYDISRILERLESMGVDPATIFCHPDVPKKYQYFKYKVDNRDCEHFADKWHWVNCTGYTQFIDSMCLYARLRKVKGRESDYTLNAIANKILGMGKISLGKITNHYMEQMYNFLRYVAYNIKDSILIPLMHKQTNDCVSMMALTDASLLSDFSKQTTMGKNSMYFYNKSQGKIIATSGMIMGTPFDDMIPKLGGTVLPPSKAINIGIRAVEESDHETQVTIMVNDEDVEAEYPSALQAFNIAKETKLFTGVRIEGFGQTHTEDYFSNVTAPKENAVYIGNKYFGLPNYQEMQKLIYERITAEWRAEYMEQ